MNSPPLSQLVFESDLLVEDGAYELIDETSGLGGLQMASPYQPELASEPLLLNPPEDFFERPSTPVDPSQMSIRDWLRDAGPLNPADAFDDHRYGPSDSDFDRIVNATHDYYDKVSQMDFDNDQAEHSYAHILPQRAAGIDYRMNEDADAGLDVGSAYVPACESVSPSISSSFQDKRSHTTTQHELPLSSKQAKGRNKVIVRKRTGPMIPKPPGQGFVPPMHLHLPPGVEPCLAIPDAYGLEDIECKWCDEVTGVKCRKKMPRFEMEAHVSAEHIGRGVRRPVCRWDKCNKTFVRRYLMLRHIRVLHCNDKPYACSECGERFALREKMKFHQRLKHGMHPQLKLPNQKTLDGQEKRKQRKEAYPCGECDMSFRTTAHRRHHVEGVHERTGVECHICGQILSDRSGLRRHTRSMHPNACICEICKHVLVDNESLVLHKQIEHNEQPASDTTCSTEVTAADPGSDSADIVV